MDRLERDAAIAREIIRQAERMLAVQDATREAAMRGVRELFRLVVASAAAVIILSVAVITTGLPAGGVAIVFSLVAVFLIMWAGLRLATLLAGPGALSSVAHGPRLERLVEGLDDAEFTEASMLLSLAKGAPGWIDQNKTVQIRIERTKGRALFALAVGDFLVLAAFVYMAGGHILG